MPIGHRIVVMFATRIRRDRSQRSAASIRVVHIMPATSKHRMDEQRSTQQAGKKDPHRSVYRSR
jgi:hypothetical protein